MSAHSCRLLKCHSISENAGSGSSWAISGSGCLSSWESTAARCCAFPVRYCSRKAALDLLFIWNISRVVRNGTLDAPYGRIASRPTIWISESAPVLSLIEIISVASVAIVTGALSGQVCKTPLGKLFHAGFNATTSFQRCFPLSICLRSAFKTASLNVEPAPNALSALMEAISRPFFMTTILAIPGRSLKPFTASSRFPPEMIASSSRNPSIFPCASK